MTPDRGEGPPRQSVLRSRPRDLEDTLAQLVHDDDPVVAASAIHFVEQRQLWSLSDDLEYAVAHRSAPTVVFEAASWALAAHRLSEKRRDLWTDPLPVVELADRLRAIPLFDFVSVDELFRIAGAARQERHEAGRELCHEGAAATTCSSCSRARCGFRRTRRAARCRSAGRARIRGGARGRPLGHYDSRGRSHGLRGARGDEFLTMLSDNIVLAQGLFRMLLDTPKAQHWRIVYAPETRL